METVMVQASTPYPVYIGGGLLDRGGELISRHTAARRCAVITDDTVCPLYGPRLCRALEAAGLESVLYVVPAGVLVCHEADNLTAARDALLSAVDAGRISMERLDESVYRILSLKQEYGLTNDPVDQPDIEALNAGIQAILPQ